MIPINVMQKKMSFDRRSVSKFTNIPLKRVDGFMCWAFGPDFLSLTMPESFKKFKELHPDIEGVDYNHRVATDLKIMADAWRKKNR